MKQRSAIPMVILLLAYVCVGPTMDAAAKKTKKPTALPAISLEPVVTGLDKPLGLFHAGDQSRRLCKPCGIPKAANFASCLIARTRASVKTFKRWRTQE